MLPHRIFFILRFWCEPDYG